MNRWQGWLIVVGGKPAVFDGRCPIYWLRKVANDEAAERGLVDAQLVKVSIVEAK